jgi:RimJ/RimL family protein N-acetyltransferase
MEIGIREDTINDAKILFDWANDLETRDNSFNSEIIDWNNHIRWFKNKLNDPASIIYILHTNEKPVGVVRFEVNETTIIGVTVTPNCRGMGLGTEILKTACNTFWKNNTDSILAYIKKGNIASLRVFEKAGFIFLREDNVNNIKCLILKATKNAH